MSMMVAPYRFGAAARPPGLQFIGRTATQADGGTGTINIPLTLSGGIDTAPIVGDFIMVIWAVTTLGVDLDPTPPTGYSEVVDIMGNDTYDTNLVVWWKFADSGDLASVTIPHSGDTTRSLAAHVRVFSGVNTSTPFDVTTTTEVGGNSQPNPAAITPVTSGAWILVAGAGGDANEAHLTNPTADLTDFVSTWQQDNNDVVLASGMKTNWTSGAFDPGAWGGGGAATSDSHASATMALRPA